MSADPEWRPYNETQTDRDREDAARVAIEQMWKCRIVKLGDKLYKVDWAIFGASRLWAYAEYKFRTKKFKEYFLMSAAKYTGGMQLATTFPDVRFLFIVEMEEEGLHYTNLTERMAPVVRYSGNPARRQNGDLEPCVIVPREWFKRIEPK